MAIGYAIFLAFYSAIIILNTWKFEHQVELVRMMNRQDLPPQNDWDFGQTTALMIWFPVAWELLTLIWKWRNPPFATPEEKPAAGVEKAVQADLVSDE